MGEIAGHPAGAEPESAGALLERAAVLDAVAVLTETVADGRAGCLVVEGPAGIGKTSVLDRASAQAAARGVQVRRATGDDLEAQLPWGMARQLFADLDPAGLEGRAALARPVLAAERAGGVGAAARGDLFPLLHGLHQLVATLASDVPLLLVLDDVQWSDPQSLRLVAYLLNRVEGLPLGIVVAARTGSGSPEVTELLGRIASVPGAVVHRLGALSDAAVLALVRSSFPSAGAAFGEALRRATGGNPFLCREALTAVRSAGIAVDDGSGVDELVALEHAGIRTAILVRLAQLGPDATTIAVGSAVLGPTGTADRLARLTDIDGRRAAAAVDLLAGAEIFAVDGTRVDFAHPIIRETVYADIGPARRAGLHRAAARLLWDEVAETSEIASHLMAAGGADETWAARVLRRAAAAAMTQGAPERAQDLLEAALVARPGADRPRILVELGRAEAAAGRLGAEARFHEALRSLELGRGDAGIAREIGEALYTAGRYDDALAAFDRGLDVLEAEPTRGGGVLEAQLVAGLVLSGTLAGVVAERALPYLVAPEPSGATPASLAQRALLGLGAARHAFGFGVPPDQHCHEVAARLSTAALSGEPLPLELGVVVLEPLTLSLYITRQLGSATQLLDRLLEEAESSGSLPAYASLLTVRGQVNVAAGRLEAAARDGHDAMRLSAEFPSANVQTEAVARRVLVEAALLMGDRGTAADAVAVDDAEGRWGDSIMYAWFLDAIGLVELDRGNAEAARESFLRAGARFLSAGGSGAHTAWRTGAAEASAALGRHDEAVELADDELQLARSFGTPVRVVEAVRARSRFLADEEAIRALEEVAPLLDETARLAGVRFELDLGAALRRTGRRRAARAHLRRAVGLARECGARGLGDRAEAELASAGARRPAEQVTGVDALTPAERRVADLAARGMTNREISTDLFVTRKTVEVHLSSCYRKLGISSREELAGRLS